VRPDPFPVDEIFVAPRNGAGRHVASCTRLRLVNKSRLAVLANGIAAEKFPRGNSM
jgi:hypothetical protein